ncbi:hypothetical protein F5888DRAFT_1805525 [Russula emetica]|nr:hypothetical protein F5888DRAFT_1805525 [Russula emetica]
MPPPTNLVQLKVFTGVQYLKAGKSVGDGRGTDAKIRNVIDECGSRIVSRGEFDWDKLVGVPLSFTSSSSFSSTSIASSSPYPNSFLPSELVRSHSFFNIVALSRSDILIPLSYILSRFITYIAPPTFVLLVTMGKEAYDDYKRNLRDREANSARYLLSHSLLKGDFPPTRSVQSSSIHVGDLVLLEKNQWVPADLILLRMSDSLGTYFIRTDRLDGETDWKLRVAVLATQKLPFDHELLNLDAEIYTDAPSKDIHTFIGTSTIKRRPLCPRTRCPWSKYQRPSRSLRRTYYGRFPISLQVNLDMDETVHRLNTTSGVDGSRSDGNVGLEEMMHGLGLYTTDNKDPHHSSPHSSPPPTETNPSKIASDAPPEGYKTFDIRVKWADQDTRPEFAKAWLAFDGFSSESARGPQTPNLFRTREKWRKLTPPASAYKDEDHSGRGSITFIPRD